MTPPVAPPDPKHPDMSPEAIDQRLRDLAQIYKLGMSLRDAKWLGPVGTCGAPPASDSPHPDGISREHSDAPRTTV